MTEAEINAQNNMELLADNILIEMQDAIDEDNDD
jgi:hypothetical protein